MEEKAMKQPRFYIGIDIAAESFTVTISTEPGRAFGGPKAFDNNIDGFQRLLEWFKEHGIQFRTNIICMEATGVYGERLCYFLEAKGYKISVEHPLKVKRAFDQSGHKNDAVDSLQIAEYAYRFFDELIIWKPREEIVEQIKTLLSTREHFVRQKTASNNALKALNRKQIQTPLANETLKETVEKLRESIAVIEQEIEELIKQDPKLQHGMNIAISAPGIGLLLGSHLLVLTDGFTRNLNHKRLASYLRICPIERQSGTSVVSKSRSKPYGPSMIRKLLYLAALSLCYHNPQFKKYFLRKCKEGKSKRLVINNIENKLLKVICAMIREDKPYIENYQSINPMTLNMA